MSKKYVVKVKDKDLGDLLKSARAGAVSPVEYLEEVIEVWFAERRTNDQEEEVSKGPRNGGGSRMSSLRSGGLLRITLW